MVAVHPFEPVSTGLALARHQHSLSTEADHAHPVQDAALGVDTAYLRSVLQRKGGLGKEQLMDLIGPDEMTRRLLQHGNGPGETVSSSSTTGETVTTKTTSTTTTTTVEGPVTSTVTYSRAPGPAPAQAPEAAAPASVPKAATPAVAPEAAAPALIPAPVAVANPKAGPSAARATSDATASAWWTKPAATAILVMLGVARLVG